MNPSIFSIAYLVAAALFIIGLRGLTHPRSARRGNYLAMAGMLLAVLATVLNAEVKSYGFIIAGVVVGGAIGTVVARRIQMTAMPQLVAILHSFVGLCAVLVAFGTYLTYAQTGRLNPGLLAELGLGALIGAVTCTGSMVAFGKLQALIPSRPLLFPGRHLINIALAVLTFGGVAWLISGGGIGALVLLTLAALVLGVLLITPIGGPDMPVVVSMLNSYSGWAAAATGFTLQNPLLIVTGALVGFSGAILSFIMCRAMNRSFISVILGGFGGEDAGAAVADTAGRSVRTASAEDAVFLLENSSKVILVPGYGMAVAQAQHAMKELADVLEEKGVEVKFAIHPVAGRMPGHMNVLLAEADVPYEQVFEMDEINAEFSSCDVALVVGANDVTNPAAKTNKASPIYGMPILEVYKTKQVLFVKRSMKPGYSGVDNELFYRDNCALVFGDAKAVCEALVAELRK